MAKKLSGKGAEKSSASGKPLTFSERFLKLREHFSLSQGELAEMIGGSPSAIGLIERGKTASPNADILAALARKLSINSDWLLLGEGEMLKDSAPALPVTIKDVQNSGGAKGAADNYTPGPTPTVTYNNKTVPTLDLTKGKHTAEPPGTDLVRQVAKHSREIELLQRALETVVAEIRQFGAGSS